MDARKELEASREERDVARRYLLSQKGKSIHDPTVLVAVDTYIEAGKNVVTARTAARVAEQKKTRKVFMITSIVIIVASILSWIFGGDE